MKHQVELHNPAFHIDVKMVALVIVIFVGGLVSGIVLFQSVDKNADTVNQEETIEITDSAVWFKNTWPYAHAAILVINDGTVAARFKEITVRGIKCNWDDVYYWKAEIGSVSEVNPASNELSGTSAEIAVDGKERTFQQAAGEITLNAYQTIVLYIKNPGNITAQDLPKKVIIAIFTEKDLYYKETGVSAQFEFVGGSEQVEIRTITFSTGTATLAIKNTGTSTVTIPEVWVNNVEKANSDLVPDVPFSIGANNQTTLTITMSWTAGDNYQFKVVTAKGNPFMKNAVPPS